MGLRPGGARRCHRARACRLRRHCQWIGRSAFQLCINASCHGVHALRTWLRVSALQMCAGEKTTRAGIRAFLRTTSGEPGPARSRVPHQWAAGALSCPLRVGSRVRLISHGLSRHAGSFARPYWRLHACYSMQVNPRSPAAKARGADGNGGCARRDLVEHVRPRE